MSSKKPMSSDLQRQRRNIMVFSAILLFLKFADIEIDKFSIVGIEFSSFNNPKTVFLVLWIAWTYFFVRYYQYFVQEGWPIFKAVYTEILERKSIKKIELIVKQKYPNNIRKDVTYSILNKWNWEYAGQIKQGKNAYGEDNIDNFKLKINRLKLVPEIILSIAHVVVNRSAFTDYFLPILIAIITLFYCFLGWDGSVLNSLKVIIT